MDVTRLIAGLNSSQATERSQAAERLAQMGELSGAAAVPLVRCCADEDESVCEWASAALEAMGPPGPGDVSALAQLISNGNSDTGYWAATLLGRLEADASDAVPQLVAAVTSGPAAVRQRAVWALGKIGPRATVAIDVLQRATADPDRRLARLSQRALASITQTAGS